MPHINEYKKIQYNFLSYYNLHDTLTDITYIEYKNRLDTKKCGIRKSEVLFIIHICSTFNKILPKKKSVVNLINTINNKFSRKSTAIPSHWVKNEITDLKRQI